MDGEPKNKNETKVCEMEEINYKKGQIGCKMELVLHLPADILMITVMCQLSI